MRIIPASIVLGIAMTTGAAASSFVTLDADKAEITPSMIVLGEEPAPALANLGAPPPVADSVTRYEGAAPDEGDFTTVSPSIIAMAQPSPPVTYEQVAAIEENEDKKEESARRRILDMPMVIRGGIVGDSFPRATGGEPAAAEEQPEPVEPPREERRADARGGKPEPEPQRPAPKPEPATQPASGRATSIVE